MGAVPSRETVEHWVSQPPFYGQRQDVVLIPLLKKFFPSQDCPLFVQLYEARCDPAVRYYYYANDGISKVQSTPTTSVSPGVYAAHEGVGNVASPTYLAEVIGNAPIYCSPADVFPSVNLTREAMYDAYITNGGERMVYETDEEMLRAYRADATSVRPLPCAVAFLYHRQASAVRPATSSAGDVDCEGSADAASINETVAVGACSFPEDCTEVLGCYVKATGFIGDVHGLGASCPRKLPDYEMQMFLTKSAGDHHRTHVLLTAVYTYAEQWQRACLHCVPCDLTAKELAPAATKNGGTAGKDLGDAFFYYKPFSQSHHMLVEANRIAGHNRTAKSAAAERNGDKSGTLEVDEKTRFWAPPPLPSLVMRSRRANVPLLCFLREMRTCARSFFLSHFKYSLEHQDLLKPGCGGSTGGADGGPDRQTENNHLTTPLDHGAGASCSLSMPPLGSVQMWLQRATRVSASLAEFSDEGSSTDTESVLNFHVVAPYVRALSEFIVACLLHNINPLEVSRLSSGPDDSATAAASTGDDSKDATATGEAPATDAVGGSAFFFTSTTDAAMMTANPPFPQSFSFIRLPDEDMLVEPWPPSSSGCETGDEASTSTAAANAAASPSSAELLSVWRSRHTNHNLFWSVGPSIVNRRTATAALLHWYRTEKAPVVWGCNLDEKDCEMVAEGKESANASCNVSAAAFPSSSLESYMSTVTVNGQEEELLRCNTVLSLMRLETGMPAEARVLRVCRIPLEELLLGELRNSSKLAREAGPEDPHWVRQADSTSGGRGATKYACCVLHASDPAEGESRTTIASKGVELPTVPPEADGIIGDGSSCLWRVTLIDRMCRIIAVTPQFLKSIRKKHPKKKKTQPKVAIVHGTAAHVFLPVVSLSPTAASPTSVPAQKGALESKESETTPARASVVTSPDRQSTVALEEAKPGGTVAVPDPLAPDATTATTAYASAAAATQAKKKTQQMANVAAAPGVASTPTVTESKAGDTVGHPPAAGAANMAVSTDPAAVVTQLKSTKGARTTPAETKKAGAARRGSSETVTHTTAVADDKQRKSSASFTSIAPAATKAKTTKPTARAPGASTTSEKANEVKAGNASSGSSAAGAAETFATTTPTAKYATIPTAERPKKTSSLPRPPQPPVPAGEYDSSSKRDKAGAGGKHPVPSAASSVGGTSSFSGASATACAPPHPPGGSYYPHPPFYEAKTLQQLLRDPYEQHGYGYRVPPPPLPFAAPHSSSNATPSYVGYYYSPDGYQLHTGYSGGFYTNINGAGYYNTDMCGGAAATADVGKHMGGSGYGDSPYVYVAQPQQLQALPPLCQQRQHTGTTGEIRREGLLSHEQSYSLPAKEEGNGYEAIPTAAPGSRQGTACSLRHHVSFEAGVGLLKEAVGDKAGLSSPRREATLLRLGGLCSGSSPISLASPNAQSPNHHHASPMPSTLRLQGSDIGELMSHDFEYHHNASVSGTGSHLHFQLDEFSSPVTNDSSIAMSNGHNWDHTRHVSSPCQTSTIIMEDAGVPWGQGCSSVGGSVNVTVRVRHHHNRTHSHAASYLSDATLDSLSTYHHHDMTHHMNRSTSVASGRGLGGRAASLNGTQMSHSCASLDHSLNALHRLSGTGCGSLREYSIAAEGDHRHQASSPREHHEHENRHHEPGVMASSTRSGDTTSAARRTDRRTGTYRWDWRTASLDMGYED